jgi:endogenous inhibitor of DNA gyrase (YacG/DUF329 family)
MTKATQIAQMITNGTLPNLDTLKPKILRGRYIEVSCMECGKRIVKEAKDILRYKTQTCSKTCSHKIQKKTQSKKVKKLCKYCQKEMLVQSGIQHRYTYCSTECRTKDQQLMTAQKRKTICSNCGTQFVRQHTAIYNHYFCSKNCQNTFHSQQMNGKRNSNYREDIGLEKQEKQVCILDFP